MKLPSALLATCLTPLLFSCVIAVGNSSCAKTIVGSGTPVSQVRGVSEFSRISAGGAVNVVARTGTEPQLVVTCDDNLAQYVLTEVRGDTLHVSMERGSYQFETPLEVTVVSPELEAASVSGASHMLISGVDTDRFDGETSGAASLRVSGRVDQIEAHVSGAGRMDLSQLTARTAQAHVSGAGKLEINARESLLADVSGAGKVRYAGAPTVAADVSGAGSVSRE